MNEFMVLDIGTGTVVGLILRPTEEGLQPLADARYPYPNRVVEEGKIVDVTGAAEVTRRVVEELREEAGVRPRTAHYAVPGRGLQRRRQEARIRLDSPRSFRESDHARLLESRDGIGRDRIIIDEEKIRCTVDGEPVRELHGQFGRQFTAEWAIRTLPIREIENKRNVLSEAQLVPGRVLLEPRAVLSACVSDDHREFPMSVFDFGAGTIDVAYMEDGLVQDVETFVGSGDQLSRDLQDEFQVSFNQSETIKHQAGDNEVEFTSYSGDHQVIDGDPVVRTVTARLKKQLFRMREWMENHHPRLIFLAGGGSQFPFLPRMIARLFDFDESDVIARPLLSRDFLGVEMPVTPADYTALGMGREISKGRGARYLRVHVNDELFVQLLTGEETYTVADLLADRGWQPRQPGPDSAIMVQLDGEWETFRSDFRQEARVRCQGETVDDDYELRSGDDLQVDPPEEPQPVTVTAKDCLPDSSLRIQYDGRELRFRPRLISKHGDVNDGDRPLEDGEEYERKTTWSREQILEALQQEGVDLPPELLWKAGGELTRADRFSTGETVTLVAAIQPAEAGLGQLDSIPSSGVPISTPLNRS